MDDNIDNILTSTIDDHSLVHQNNGNQFKQQNNYDQHHDPSATTTATSSMMSNFFPTTTSTTYFVPSVYPPFSTQSNEQSSTTDSGIAPISSYQIPTYIPPSILTNTNNGMQCLTNNNYNDNAANSIGTYQVSTLSSSSLFNPPTNVIPEQQSSMILPSPPSQSNPIYCSDGVIYPQELSNCNNVITNNQDDKQDDVILSNELVDVYNHLGIVGKLLAGGSLVTIRFLQMFRNISETLVDALGIARPKYEEEIQAYEEMRQEEQKRQEEIQRLYAGWKPNIPSPPLPTTPPTQFITPSINNNEQQINNQIPNYISNENQFNLPNS